MLSVKEAALLRKTVREAAKTAIYAFNRACPSAYVHVYEGTSTSVRYAIVSDDGKRETCYEVRIRKLGTRRVL